MDYTNWHDKNATFLIKMLGVNSLINDEFCLDLRFWYEYKEVVFKLCIIISIEEYDMLRRYKLWSLRNISRLIVNFRPFFFFFCLKDVLKIIIILKWTKFVWNSGYKHHTQYLQKKHKGYDIPYPQGVTLIPNSKVWKKRHLSHWWWYHYSCCSNMYSVMKI